MAYRGGRGGRGGWGRGGGNNYAKQEPYVLFPDIELPDRKDVKDVKEEEKELLKLSMKWENFWKSSAYYLEEETASKNEQSRDVERYSDRATQKATSKRDSMYQILQLTSSNFPRVLITGSKELRSRKRVRWNPVSESELFEQLLKKEDNDEKGEKKTQEGEDGSEKEEDDDERPEEPEDELSDIDYIKTFEFDDDDDDYNPGDGGDDEPCYD